MSFLKIIVYHLRTWFNISSVKTTKSKLLKRSKKTKKWWNMVSVKGHLPTASWPASSCYMFIIIISFGFLFYNLLVQARISFGNIPNSQWFPFVISLHVFIILDCCFIWILAWKRKDDERSEEHRFSMLSWLKHNKPVLVDRKFYQHFISSLSI